MDKIIIAAVSNNNVIGKEGKIPWHSRAELKHFKETTMGYPILMGRKTFESIGKALKGRLNIIISRNDKMELPQGVLLFNDLLKAFDYCKHENYARIFIIGGGEIYKQAIRYADTISLTVMDFDTEGDTYFPYIDPLYWKQVKTEEFEEFIIRTYKRSN